MMNKSYRLPAEWEGDSAILISWPHRGTDWQYMLDTVTECYIAMVRAFSKVAHIVIVSPDATLVAESLKGFVEPDRYTVLEMPTNDTWARDFGFISVTGADGEINALDYKFNGWGLKFASCHDNLITRHIFASGIISEDKARYINRLGFVLEGGSIDIDQRGVLLTTSECLLSPNRNGEMSREEIEQVLIADLGASKVVWLEHGALDGDDTDSHVDTLARFLPGRVIAYTSCDRADDDHYADLKAMEEEIMAITDVDSRHYKTVALPIPEAIYDEEGQRLPATYANFLIVNGTIFMPVYGDEYYDRIAIERIKTAAPEYKVIPIDCRALIQQHGSLHCVTMQFPRRLLAISLFNREGRREAQRVNLCVV